MAVERPEVDFSISDFSPSESDLVPERGVFKTLSAPVTVQWEVTPWCNEKCLHCYNYWRSDKIDMSPYDSIFEGKLSEVAREIIQDKVFQVTITGGEPLAVYSQVLPFIETLTSEGVLLSLNSNLTMLTREKAKDLKRVGIRSILTSLMSHDPELNDELANRPNTHKDVSRGIRLALDEGHWVGVNMVVTKKNLDHIYDTAVYVKSLGVTSFSATKASIPAREIDFSEYLLSPDDFNVMLNELIKVRDELGLSVDSLEFYPICSFSSQEQIDTFGGRICNALMVKSDHVPMLHKCMDRLKKAEILVWLG